jgi:hypothetical protein
MLRTYTTLDIDWNKRRYTAYIGLLFFLFMLDYFLTYYGVCYLEIRREVNPFMIWLFEVPLISGTLLRLTMSLVLVKLMNSVYEDDNNIGIGISITGIVINLLILYHHIHWMTNFRLFI